MLRAACRWVQVVAEMWEQMRLHDHANMEQILQLPFNLFLSCLLLLSLPCLAPSLASLPLCHMVHRALSLSATV